MIKARTTLQNLQQLLTLKDADVARLQREVADKRQLQERYQRNIQRMDELCRHSGASGSRTLPALALNCAGYKDALLQLKQSQQLDLQLAEADTAVSQQALLAASRRREVLASLQQRTAADLAQQQQRQEQKRSDDQASLAWLRQQGPM